MNILVDKIPFNVLILFNFLYGSTPDYSLLCLKRMDRATTIQYCSKNQNMSFWTVIHFLPFLLHFHLPWYQVIPFSLSIFPSSSSFFIFIFPDINSFHFPSPFFLLHFHLLWYQITLYFISIFSFFILANQTHPHFP